MKIGKEGLAWDPMKRNRKKIKSKKRVQSTERKQRGNRLHK